MSTENEQQPVPVDPALAALAADEGYTADTIKVLEGLQYLCLGGQPRLYIFVKLGTGPLPTTADDHRTHCVMAVHRP